MEKLRRSVDACVQRAMDAQRLSAEAQRLADAAHAKARRALDWISERNELTACQADERARRQEPRPINRLRARGATL